MGVLDDAIREHLELKRKHGVSEEELQRQEEEALGPARREAARQHEEAEPTPGQTATAEAEEPGAHPAGEEAALFDMEEESADVLSGEEAEPTHAAADSAALHEPPTAEATPVEPPPVEPPPDEPHRLDAVEDEEDFEEEGRGKRELDEDELLESEDEADENPDVLEDTPDFLQETPEHDRLWFEQKPPRDFDFD
jgi:hypothetical protein